MISFILLVLAVDSMQRCSHPQAEDGHQVTEGCLQRTCKLNIWRSSLVSNKCCYEREAYYINTTIYSSMSKDGCAEASIDCVEETPGNAKTVLSVKNYCDDYATKEQLEEIKEILAEQIEAGQGCLGENMEEKDIKEDYILLLGPDNDSDGKSEVLSLPDLTPLNCNIPVFPGGYYQGYVGRSTSDGVLMCGGETKRYEETSSCYLLTSSGYKTMAGLLTKRSRAATVVTPLGLWVTGGWNDGDRYLDTTEIWNNNQSLPHVKLPMAVYSHCLLSLNTTHVLLTGGTTGFDSSAAFIYSEGNGFTRIQDMKTPRYDHGCSVINESTVIVAGGYVSSVYSSSVEERSTEYLDLTSLTWSPGPELPRDVFEAQMLGPEVLGPEIGGHLLIGDNKIYKLEEGLAQTRGWTEVTETKYYMDFRQAFVVNQTMFCENQL